VAGILAMIRTLGALIDRRDAADTLADSLARRLEAITREQQHRNPRPRVFFEEWDEPLIAGIGRVSELIEIAGGSDVCWERRRLSNRAYSVTGHRAQVVEAQGRALAPPARLIPRPGGGPILQPLQLGPGASASLRWHLELCAWSQHQARDLSSSRSMAALPCP